MADDFPVQIDRSVFQLNSLRPNDFVKLARLHVGRTRVGPAGAEPFLGIQRQYQYSPNRCCIIAKTMFRLFGRHDPFLVCAAVPAPDVELCSVIG